MKNNYAALTLCILIFLTSSNISFAQTGVKISATAGTAHPSAMLDVESTTKGALFPRMTLAQKNAISSPATGLVVYQTDGSSGLYYYNGSAWVQLSAGALSGAGTVNYITKWTSTSGLGNSQIFDNGTNVGIGTSSPGAKLDINGQIKISGGGPGAGKVLTSDANGLATWEPEGKGEYNSGTVAAGNWYRIAQNSGNRANAQFTLRDYISGGGHSTLVFRAGVSYNYASGMSFTVLNHNYYSTPTFTYVRILTNTTYDVQYLEVYANRPGSVDYSITDNLQSAGWTPVDWTAGSVPGGYTVRQYDVNYLFSAGDYTNRFSVTRGGGIQFSDGSVQNNAVRIYRSQVATGVQYSNWLPGSITFDANAGDQVTLKLSYSGRPNSWGHSYIDLYMDGAYVKGIGEEQNSTWRRTIDGEVNLTVSSSGSHTFTAYFSCGSGMSYMYDTGGEWPYGGLTWTVMVGGN